MHILQQRNLWSQHAAIRHASKQYENKTSEMPKYLVNLVNNICKTIAKISNDDD